MADLLCMPAFTGRRSRVKRLLCSVITTVILFLPFQAIAEAKGVLTYDRAVALLNLNSMTLKSLERAENDARESYESNAVQAQKIDTEGFTINFGGKDYYINYDPETKVNMKKAKELYPEQLKFSWEAAGKNRHITSIKLKETLRGVFFGVYNASADIKLKQKQLDLALKINNQDKVKLKRGLITSIDMQESDYNLAKAQNSLIAAKRNYENATRSFDQFIGVSAKTQYTDVIYEEKLSGDSWKSVDYYIDQALENRFEIVSLRRQMELKEQEKAITESSYVYKNSTTLQDEYETLLNDIEQLNIDIENAKLSITDEIRNAYVDVIKAEKNVRSLSNALKLQQSSYSKMQARYKAGMISENALEQAEIGLLQFENGYKAALFDYNTRVMRFGYATGIGPEY